MGDQVAGNAHLVMPVNRAKGKGNCGRYLNKVMIVRDQG